MGRTTSEVKNRYNTKTYDFIKLAVKKGEKDKIKELAAMQGKSLSGFIIDLVNREMGTAKTP